MKHTLNLERGALGELDPSTAAQVDAALVAAGEPPLDDQLHVLRESNAEILQRLPPKAVAAEVARRAATSNARASSPWPSFRWAYGGGLAAACAAFLVLVWSANPSGDGVRAKGAPVGIGLQSVDGAIFSTDDVASAGDQFVMRVQPGASRFIHVASVDGNGAITRHHPIDHASGAVTSPGAFTLPNAFVLDAAPAFERFFVIGANEPIVSSDVDAAIKALVAAGTARAGTLNAPAAWVVEDRLVLKR